MPIQIVFWRELVRLHLTQQGTASQHMVNWHSLGIRAKQVLCLRLLLLLHGESRPAAEKGRKRDCKDGSDSWLRVACCLNVLEGETTHYFSMCFEVGWKRTTVREWGIMVEDGKWCKSINSDPLLWNIVNGVHYNVGMSFKTIYTPRHFSQNNHPTKNEKWAEKLSNRGIFPHKNSVEII